MVQFENVGLRYGTGGEILSNLSFSLERGSFNFLTGPSGAGKTSLINLITLACRPSRGIIRLFDEDLADLPRARLPDLRRRIGVVYQDFRLVPQLSAFDNIALPLRIAGMASEEIGARVTELLDWVGLTSRANAYPETLSGGEQQRVAIARAVITRPELIVADEPTGNVDPDMARRLLRLLEGLHRGGATILVATHDIHLLGRIDHSALMRLTRGTLDFPGSTLHHMPGVAVRG